MPGIAIPSGDLSSFNAALIEFVEGRLQLRSSLRNGLIGNWKINEKSLNGTPDEVEDSSPNLNHGVAVGTPPTTVPGFNGTRRGEVNGTVDYFRVPTLTGISGTQGTILLWLNLDVDNGQFNWFYQLTPFTTTHTTTGIIVSLDMRAGEKNYRIIAAVDGTVQWDWHSADGAAILGTNHSFEISHNGLSPVFYLNGVDITAAGTFTVSTDLTAWYDDWIGATTPISDLILGAVISSSSILDPFNGKVWGVVMLDRVMTAGERTAHYNDGAGRFIEDGPFSDASPIATSPKFAIDQNTLDAITPILLQLILEGTATIKFQWNLNDDGFNGTFLTPAQLLAALAGLSITDHINSMQFMYQFNSNTIDQAAILLPQTKAEASGITAGADQAAIGDVRLNTVYNDGNNTGTLAVPPKGEVGQGVATDDGVGTYVKASVADVAQGVQYGEDGTALIGEFIRSFIGEIEIVEVSNEIELVEV